jgi:hypothetical protein
VLISGECHLHGAGLVGPDERFVVALVSAQSGPAARTPPGTGCGPWPPRRRGPSSDASPAEVSVRCASVVVRDVVSDGRSPWVSG